MYLLLSMASVVFCEVKPRRWCPLLSGVLSGVLRYPIFLEMEMMKNEMKMKMNER
jgi:hypothetical protein